MTADLEVRLLASLPDVDSFHRLEEEGIVEEMFLHYRPMYQYIKEIVAEHKHLPRFRDLVETFNVPDWVKREPNEYHWLVSEFQRVVTATRLQEIVDRNVEQHGDNPQLVVDALIKDLTAITRVDGRHASLTAATMTRRLQTYADREGDASLIKGIPTGLSYFDAVHQLGWMPGELVGLVGRTFVGKTWFMMYFGLIAWLAGHRVLMLSPELPVEEAEARFDVLVYGTQKLEIDFSQIYRGFKPDEKVWEAARDLSGHENWTTLASAEGHPFRLSELPRLIRKHNPRLVLIDGLPFLMSGIKRQQSWEQVMDISYGLKTAAVASNVVILTSHQATRSAAANLARAPGLHEIAFGDAFAQACDRLLAIAQPKDRPQQRDISVQKFRKGQPQRKAMAFHFEPGRGRIYEYSNTGAADQSGAGGQADGQPSGDEDPVPIP